MIKKYPLAILFCLLVNYACITRAQTEQDRVHAVITSEKVATISSPMDGYIDKLYVKEGSHFKKDGLLLQFDCRLQLAENKKVKAELNLAKLNLDSQQRLNQLGSASKLKMAEAIAQLEKTQAELEISQKKISDCQITAPFSGQITELFVHQHETIKANQKIFRILNNQDLIVKLLLPSHWLKKISLGKKFRLFIEETNQIYQAKVIRINDEVDPVSRSIKIIANIETKTHALKSGMSGYAIFKGNE